MQNYANHSRYVPLYHFIASTLLVAVTVGSFVNLKDAIAKATGVYSASLICVLAVTLILVWWFSRSFALKAQDRAIRAEENFRHYILTGKPLDSKLRMGQIIALRFAADAEMPALAQRAVAESLSSKQIKQAIQQWKEDHHRV